MGLTLRLDHLVRAFPGEAVSGDAIVLRSDGRVTLFGVIDALGHGPIAADVARRGLETLEAVPLDRDVSEAMWTLHRALAGTRGAAVTLCRFHDGGLEIAGVGNVEVQSLDAAVGVVLRPGVVGHRIGSLRVCASRPSAGARVVVFSDGVRAGLDLEGTRGMPPSAACAWILERYARATDDAAVLVADVIEAPAAEG